VFKVHTPGGVVESKPSEHGLHYLDMAEHGKTVQHMLVMTTNGQDNDGFEKEEEDGSDDFIMVSTVRGNYEGFMKHKIKKAQEARRLQGMIGKPMEREFEGMVHEKLIANCPITVRCQKC
jgi:hypothetical protein